MKTTLLTLLGCGPSLLHASEPGVLAMLEEQADEWQAESALPEKGMNLIELGYCYQHGIGVPRDTRKTILTILLAGASCLASENRAATETRPLRLHPSAWYPHIKIHSPETCFSIGNALMQGKPDSSDASYWLWRAARKGHIEAAYQLAEFLIPPSEDEHEKWLEFAAEQGHREAQLSLAMTYSSQGEWEQSVYWLTRASANHNARAMLELGMYCELGFGTPASRQDALFWYENAYKTPSAFHTFTKLYAARELVSLYRDMPPTPPNIIAAIQWYNRAASQGCNMQRLQDIMLDNPPAISGIRFILRLYGWRDRKRRDPFAR